jgi:general secretion pathway protein G
MTRKGFTLIELLIVVAIIAILAAIAVPNFLEAQVRSKVSRQLANMRTVTTALESYYVDNNRYPICTGFPGVTAPVTFSANETWKIWPGYENTAAGVTTPIAYVTGAAAMEDIFRVGHHFESRLAYQIMFLPTNYYPEPTFTAQNNRYGLWVMRSAGPDTYYQNKEGQQGDYGAGGWGLQSYDATNGTLSSGDIYRSQKRPDEDHS